MTNFESNWRRKQEIKGRPYADKIYKRVFGSDVDVSRFDNEDDFLLDKRFAMDVILRLENGLVLTGQEKFLSPHYAKYATVTIEYMQSHANATPGDWFKMATQFYFVAYFNKDYSGFCKWVILNWPAAVLATDAGVVRWKDNINKADNAQASFRVTPMIDLPSGCVIASDGIT